MHSYFAKLMQKALDLSLAMPSWRWLRKQDFGMISAKQFVTGFPSLPPHPTNDYPLSDMADRGQ